jgi:hypothetical protein
MSQCFTLNFSLVDSCKMAVSISGQQHPHPLDLLGNSNNGKNFIILIIQRILSSSVYICTECPTRYRTRHFFNNSNTNEDIAMKFEQGYISCVRNEEECVFSAPNCYDTEQRSKYAGFGSEWDTLYIQGVPGGMCETSGGCSLC